MKDEQLQDQLQAYITNAMSATERTDFEREINRSDSLMQEVMRFRQLHILLRHQPLLQAKAALQAIMDQTPVEANYGPYAAYFAAPPRRVFPRWRWFMLAMVPLLLVGAGLAYRYAANRQAQTALAAARLEPMVNVIGFAVGDTANAARAMRAYDQANYTEAISRLRIELQQNPDDNGLRLYLAVSYLMQQQPGAAEPLLRQAVQPGDLTAVPAKWYLALCLLQRGRKAESIALLQDITTDVIFGKRAGELLDALAVK